MVKDDVWDIVPRPKGKLVSGGSSRSSSLRGSVDDCSLDRNVRTGFVSNVREVVQSPFYFVIHFIKVNY
jgi:hypothetical protein